ncbi:MAG: DNA polymerase IV [Cellvibrionaceae bacterium]
MGTESEKEKPVRKIIHCDADCFFAALEMREDPSLRNKPIAVGGSEEKRGVISTCNYEARTYGVHSAMASAHAKRLCPDLIIVPHNMELYREASNQMREIFHSYTDLVEPLSMDEAFLDVSDVNHCHGSATLIAKEIRQRIEDTVNITVSAGVAPNKFLAKIASDWVKPNGLTVILPEQVDSFVQQLPVKKIYGVGKVTAEKLKRQGVVTCGDLQKFDEFQLTRSFGSMGLRLYELARGQDERKVKSVWRRKSLSVEHTFPKDLPSLEQCISQLPSLMQQMQARLRRLDKNYRAVKGFVKVKFTDFTVTTIERVGTSISLEDYTSLLAEAFERGNKPVRLLGVGVRLIDLQQDQNQSQLDLFPELAINSV